jgi:hypothetical protein
MEVEGMKLQLQLHDVVLLRRACRARRGFSYPYNMRGKSTESSMEVRFAAWRCSVSFGVDV